MVTKFFNVSIDPTLSTNSNILVPSEKAVRSFIASKSIQLDFLQSSAPTTYTTGQKWLNTSDKKVYTAISNSNWGTGSNISVDQFFTFEGLLYYFDGTNINEYSTSTITEYNSGNKIKMWVGTREEYDLITTKDPDTLYQVEENSVDFALLATQSQFNNADNTVAATPYQVIQKLGNYLALSGGNLNASAILGFTNANNEVSTLAYDVNGYLNVSNKLYVTYETSTNSLVVRSGNVYKTNTSGATVVWSDSYATTSKGGAVKPDGTTITINNGVISASGSGSLANTATGTNSLTILGTPASSNNAANVGSGSEASTGSTALGYNAKATDTSCIQLGQGTNSTANSFQVFNYQMLDANGHIPNERIYYPQPLYKGYTITGSDVTVNDNNVASGFTSYGNQDNRNSYLLVNNKIPNSFGLLEMYVGFTCGNYNEDKGYSLITRNDSISTTWYVQGNSSDNTDYRIQRWNGTANVVGSTSLSKDQSYVARYIYNKTNGNTEQCDLYINGAWVNQWNNSNVNVTWNNIYVGIGGAYCYGDTSQTGSINLNQTAIYVDGVCLFNGVKNWIPSTAAITGVPGYDSTKTQVLKNVNGTLTWVDE